MDEITAEGGKALAVVADATDEVDVDRLRDQAIDRFGGVDVLVNNAGVGKYGPLGSLSVADFDWMMRHALSRPAQPREVEIVSGLLESQRQHYSTHKEDAAKLVQIGLHKPAEDIDVVELAAWTSIARAIFNMHEFITRN